MAAGGGLSSADWEFIFRMASAGVAAYAGYWFWDTPSDLTDFMMQMGRKGHRVLKKFREAREHNANARESNREKHEGGNRRRARDRGGEKGDKRRSY